MGLFVVVIEKEGGWEDLVESADEKYEAWRLRGEKQRSLVEWQPTLRLLRVQETGEGLGLGY